MIFLERAEDLFLAIFKNGSRQHIDFPDSNVFVTLRNLWNMMEWNYESFAQDCIDYFQSGRFKREEPKIVRLRAMIFEIGRKHENRPIMQFGLRNNARAILQINLCSLMEGILLRFYEVTAKQGNGLFPIQFVLDQGNLEQRYEEMKLNRLYRNKLAAHTSFQDPRKDPDSLQWSSLLHLQGAELFAEDNPASFFIGGNELLDVKKEYGSQVSEAVSDHLFSDKYVIRDEFKKMQKHFGEWELMLVNQIKHFYAQCPLKTNEYQIIRWDTINGPDDMP